jgi:hypothetical protein
VDLLDVLFIGFAGVRGPRLQPDRVLQWPTWGVVALCSLLWTFVALPLLYVIAIASGHARLIVGLAVGPGVAALTAALVTSILTATHRLEREGGHRLAGILLSVSGALVGLGLTGLVFYGVFAVLNVFRSMG